MSIERLASYGFRHVGHWQLDNYASTPHLFDLPGIGFFLESHHSDGSGVVYAFTIDDTIAYIGETSRLRSRCESYRYGNPLKTDTDNRVKLELTDALQHDRTVEIWALVPEAQVQLGKHQLTLSASKPIEGWLIAELNPKLNRHGRVSPNHRPRLTDAAREDHPPSETVTED